MDFIILSSAFQCIDGNAMNDINLGSGHRAVRGDLQVHAYILDVKVKGKIEKVAPCRCRWYRTKLFIGIFGR